MGMAPAQHCLSSIASLLETQLGVRHVSLVIPARYHHGCFNFECAGRGGAIAIEGFAYAGSAGAIKGLISIQGCRMSSNTAAGTSHPAALVLISCDLACVSTQLLAVPSL